MKGKPPLIEYGPRRWDMPQIKEITFGSLAKVPTTFTDEQLQNIHVVDAREILSWPIPEVATEDRPVKGASTGGSSPLFDEEDTNLLPYLETVWSTLVEGVKLKAKDRTRIDAKRSAVQLLIYKWCYAHPNKDGSLPVAGIKALWEWLYDNGFTQKTWNYHCHKTMRDFLSDNYYLNVIDNTYNPPVRNGNGEVMKKGKAMRYSITDEFYEVLVAGEAPSNTHTQIDGAELPLGTGERLEPVMILIFADFLDVEKEIEAIVRPFISNLINCVMFHGCYFGNDNAPVTVTGALSRLFGESPQLLPHYLLTVGFPFGMRLLHHFRADAFNGILTGDRPWPRDAGTK